MVATCCPSNALRFVETLNPTKMKKRTRTIHGLKKSMLLMTLLTLLLVLLQACNSDDALPGPTDPEKERYVDLIFDSVNSSTGSYGSFSVNNYEFFEPTGDSETSRPMIILSPGGNHTSFTRKDKLIGMCKNLAKRGYVTAVIEYAQVSGTIDGKLQDFSDLYVLGIRDQRSAIRYFRKNADQFGVDPNKIFIGGWSTGATLSFGTAFMSEEEMRSITDANLRSTVIASLEEFGGLDSDENLGVSSQANGALIIMGLSFDVSHIDSSIPLMMINHEKAVTVSDCQSFTNEVLIKTIDTSLTAYGTNLIFDQAKKSGLSENADLEYIYQTNWESGWKECDWYPNVSTLTSDNYQVIAEFFHRNLQ